MVMEFTLIPMEDLTKVNGLMASNMERVSSLLHKELREKVSGTRAKGSSGSTTRKINSLINIWKIKTGIEETIHF